ncbi:MAG: hypothetical protein AAGA56_16515, partial [Myxococcota bacterium]
CHSTGGLALAEDGTVYVTSDNAYVLPRFNSDQAPSSCVLRILPDADTFDSEWIIRIRDLTDGRDATGFRYIGEGIATLFVFHDDLLPSGIGDDLRSYYSSLSSRWWRIDLNAQQAAPIEGLPDVVSGSGISSQPDSSSVWLALPTEFPADSNRYIEVGADGAIQERFRFQGRGQIWSLD